MNPGKIFPLEVSPAQIRTDHTLLVNDLTEIFEPSSAG